MANSTNIVGGGAGLEDGDFADQRTGASWGVLAVDYEADLVVCVVGDGDVFVSEQGRRGA